MHDSFQTCGKHQPTTEPCPLSPIAIRSQDSPCCHYRPTPCSPSAPDKHASNRQHHPTLTPPLAPVLHSPVLICPHNHRTPRSVVTTPSDPTATPREQTPVGTIVPRHHDLQTPSCVTTKNTSSRWDAQRASHALSAGRISPRLHTYTATERPLDPTCAVLPATSNGSHNTIRYHHGKPPMSGLTTCPTYTRRRRSPRQTRLPPSGLCLPIRRTYPFATSGGTFGCRGRAS